MAFLKSFAIFILASGGMSAGMFFRVRVIAMHPERKEFMSEPGVVGTNKNGDPPISAKDDLYMWQTKKSVIFYLPIHSASRSYYYPLTSTTVRHQDCAGEQLVTPLILTKETSSHTCSYLPLPMSSGIKRHYHDDVVSASGRSDKSQESDRKKPRDWREAFLDDSPRREHGREKERDRERPRGSGRDYNRERQYRDRRRSYDDRRGERYDERMQGNGEHRSGQRDRKDYREREPEKGDYSRRYGDRSDRHRNDCNDYRRDVRYNERGECVLVFS